MGTESTTLVLGATGSFGGGIAAELLARHRPVRALARDASRVRTRFPGTKMEVVTGDALDLETVLAAAKDCDIIVHGINYPYDQWDPHMFAVTDGVIAAAREAGAMILFPGNVYGLGAQTEAPLAENAENQSATRKGRIRVRLEEALRAAAEAGDLRALVLRAGDYFGPTVRNGLVDRIFGRALEGRPMQVFGRLDIAHQWAYIPDLARAGVDLLEVSERLRPYDVVHFEGFIARPQMSFLHIVAEQAGKPGLAARVTPWWLLRLVAPFSGVIGELLELRYLFDESVVLDGSRLRALLPEYEDTPVEEAVRATLESYARHR